jgi:hypothetical protein
VDPGRARLQGGCHVRVILTRRRVGPGHAQKRGPLVPLPFRTIQVRGGKLFSAQVLSLLFRVEALVLPEKAEALHAAHAIEVDLSVQVVALVLDDTGEEAPRFE